MSRQQEAERVHFQQADFQHTAKVIVNKNKHEILFSLSEIFCSWNVAAFLFVQHLRQIAFSFYLHFTGARACSLWREYVWHLGMAQCEQTGHHWDGPVGCLFNALPTVKVSPKQVQ